MSKKLPPWVKLPSQWIEAGGLRDFGWARGQGANNLAALMALTVISHHIDLGTGVARLSYDMLCEKTSLSRAKISAGLDILATRGLLDRGRNGRSSYGLAGYDPDLGWAKFPAEGLYHFGVVAAFTGFHLRLRTELDALKLYFLFAARRDRRTNLAKIKYETIEDYSGVPRDCIRRALSLLAANGLVHVERVPSEVTDSGYASAYRLAHLDSYHHMGTTGRSDLFAD